MMTMDEVSRLQAMEYVRQMGGTTEAGIEFSKFAVGFPDTMELDQIWLSYLVAKHGPEAISMDTQGESE